MTVPMLARIDEEVQADKNKVEEALGRSVEELSKRISLTGSEPRSTKK
jgi:hypothetical protein